MKLNKKLLLLILFGAILSANGQEWNTNFEKAKIKATKNNRNIVLVFQGSDWCVPCIKLDKEIWSTEEFQNYAKDRFVMLRADFPRKKKNKLSEEQQNQNNHLAEHYNRNGFFPFVVVLDKNGKVLGETSYIRKSTPSEYIKLLESFKD
ncbi:thioredoxin fold domain-containing protein [Flavobacteriaceae bacterium R38]|nr:thioredoxin fold domain-containing protein [Flavobacteriaceae bacterium R38]